MRRRHRARHPRQGGRADRRGPPAPGGEAPARGRDLGQHPVVQEQHRFGRQLVRLPRELSREPRRKLPATGRGAHPLLRHPADRGGRRQGAPDPARLSLLPLRAQHICQEISGATTSSRSIINTRDEPHADAERYRRLHVIVGDSNMSEVATYLKIGTTALVLDMIEDGFFDRDYSLQSPVQAIRDISHDPTLREAIKLKDGRTITALQMQLEYLEYATRYVDSISPDPATKDVLARWTDVLGKLETDPMQLSRELDWVIKRQLIENYMNRHRLTWRDPKVSLLDLQYHDIRPDKGVYYRLVANDHVDRITDDETIEQAKHVPPQTTRARRRGEFIRRANLRGKDYRVDWVYLKLNDPEGETILCKDPFQSHDERVERLIRSF